MSARTSPITYGSSACWARDFGYRRFFEYPDHTCWISAEHGEQEHPHFGGAQAIYNVIDSRQADPQANVIEALRGMGYTDAADRYVHFSYEMVALTPRCAEELGYTLSDEDRGRPYIEVSGRKGFGVKADDLIDRLIAAATAEVDSRHPELDDAERLKIGTSIAIGALRYFMLKYTRNSVIAFDFHDALSFEGETGPYVQYAVVRVRSIFRKAGTTVAAALAAVDGAALSKYVEGEDGRDIWELWQTAVEDLAAAGAVHCHGRARLPGEACLPARAAVQQLLPPLPHPDRDRMRRGSNCYWQPPQLQNAS